MGFDWSEATKGLHEMLEGFAARLPYTILALVVFTILLLAGRFVGRTVQKLATRKKRHHHNLGLVLGRLVSGATIFIALLVAMMIASPTFKPGQLVQILGIGSVAIGFAFRDILQNFLAGIIILLTEPFRLGDQIQVKEFEGAVEQIQTRATFIKTYDGRRIVIPNSDMFTEAVTVNTAFDKRRLEYDVTIGYSDDPERAKEIIRQTLLRVPGVLSEPPPDVLVYDLGASGVSIRVRWWVKPPLRSVILSSRDQVLIELRKALVQHGIDIPYQTHQVLFHDQTEETDGDRTRQREGWSAPENSEAPRRSTIAGALDRLAKAIAGSQQREAGKNGRAPHESPERNRS